MNGGKKKSKGSQHQTMSFEQMVGKANREALKPFILETVSLEIANLGNQMAQRFFENVGNIQTRIMAMERILIKKLNITQDEINNTVLDIEDEGTNFKKVDRPAQKGDYLRVSVRTRPVTQPDFRNPVKKEIAKLGSKPFALTESLEEALVGMQAGETKVVLLEGRKNKDGEWEVPSTEVEMKIDRISEDLTPPPPAPVKEGNDASPNA